MHSLNIFKDITDALVADFPANEAREFSFLILEHLFQLRKTDILSNKTFPYSESQQALIFNYIQRLKCHEPIQYITGEAYFLGRSFRVSPEVLIPRGETEELVMHCVKRVSHIDKPKILDVCTGSGCIAISLALHIPEAHVTGVDISLGALDIAKSNALRHAVDIQWLHADVLHHDIEISQLDLIVSNPPYVMDLEKKGMDRNVLDYEPHIALFVPDTDPLLFYSKITQTSLKLLAPGGSLAYEINERMGPKVAEVLATCDFEDVEVLQDIHGKDRFVIGKTKKGM